MPLQDEVLRLYLIGEPYLSLYLLSSTIVG